MNRDIKHIVVHCSYTPPQMDIGAKDIDRWHRERGWMGIGYHGVITRKGKVEMGRPLDKTGAHVRSINRTSRGICLIGGMTRDKSGAAVNYSDDQLDVLRLLIDDWKEHHFPLAKVSGHVDWDKGKTCPNFDAAHWYETGQVISNL
jgi:N-acetylmuramoyl-L-alanine amidase